MQIRELINKEDVVIDGQKYFISSIPAVECQKILLKSFSAFSQGNIAAIPPELLTELLSYCGIYNKMNAEVQFVDEETITMSVADPMVIIELEARMVEKNFSFLADGRLTRVMERLSKAFSPATAS